MPRRDPSSVVLLDDDGCTARAKDLEECLDRLKEFIWPYAGMLHRKELRGHCEDFVRGLLSDLDRKSTEPIAERAGKVRRGMQRFIGESEWDYEPLLGKLCREVADGIGSPDGVLVIDPTSLIKKGHASVGVARQWCGRTGQVENCQQAVFLGYVSGKERTLVDVRLFMPKEWIADQARRAECHVPESVGYQSQHNLGLAMLRERSEAIPHAWVTADGDFGRSQNFRRELREMGERYVLATAPAQRVRDAEGPMDRVNGRQAKAPTMRVDRFKDLIPARDWKRIEVRAGTKGPLVLWAARARVQASLRLRRDKAVEWLIVMRTEGAEPEFRYYLSNAAVDVPIEKMVRAACSRYWIEDCFERAKGRVGLGHCEARTWLGWHHHVTLTMLALWFLVREQRRLGSNTPAMTLQQSAEAVSELLRNPAISTTELAQRITRRLRRTETARRHHWESAARRKVPDLERPLEAAQ